MAGPSKVGSIKQFQSSVKSGGGNFLKDIPKNGMLNVRFLTDPDEWVEFEQWYQKSTKTFGIILDDSSIVPDDADVSRRYLANVLDTNEGKVIPLRIPRTLAEDLNAYYEKYGSLTDRDYELTRMGENLSTKYRAVPDAVMDRPLTRYECVDLIKALEDNEAFSSRKRTGKTQEANTPSPKPPATRKLVRTSTAGGDPASITTDIRGVPEEREPVEVAVPEETIVEGPDSFAGDDSDGGEGDFYTPDQIRSKTLGELKFIARDNGVETTGMNRDEIIAALLGEDSPSESTTEEAEPF